MTTTPKVLIESKLAEILLTMQYTAINCKASIDKLTAVNVTAANVTFTAHLVPPGGAADATNKLAPVTIAPGKGWLFPDGVGQILESGGSIWSIAGTVSAISLRASGREFT